jgi:chemotaxis protein MotB
MQEISFFLLKNWLPVGIPAILFFAIGLLLAKFIWGRHTQRLANAIEENMNLASQWSALGASQQDLFKRLRVRWQADRDAYETVLAEKEARLSLIGTQLRASGTDVSALGDPAGPEIDAYKKVMELEAALASEKTETAKLRGELEKRAELPILPFAVNGLAEAPAPNSDDALHTRLRELEQDLIDTHDELHRVRGDYEKQVELVESLEAKLIAGPETVLPAAEEAPEPVELLQLRALMAQRARELRQRRLPLDTVSERTLESAQAEASLVALRAELESAKAEFEAKEKALLADRIALETSAAALRVRFENQAEEDAVRLHAKDADLSRVGSELAERSSALEEARSRITALEAELAERSSALEEARSQITALEAELAERSSALEEARSRITALEAELAERSRALEEARSQIEALESIARRKVALQSELNDACHELYDVRRALHHRIETITALEAKLGLLSETESRNAALQLELEGSRADLAATLQSLAEVDLARAEGVETIASLQALHQSHRAEATSLLAQINDTRRELSDLRIALAAKSDDYQKALGQMEELEAIIGDRSAEVNDLSAELRQQRDLVRQLKNTLAETQGELDALSEESRVLNAGAKARTQFTEEQQVRIASLELALAERYRDLNRIRIEAEEHSRNSKHFQSKSVQLESELQRRQAEFDTSDRRVASVEGALEAAHAKAETLCLKLEKAESSLGQLRDELRAVSRDKEDTIRDLDRVSRRVSELEEAAQRREAQIAALERHREEAGSLAVSLEETIRQLRVEVEGATEETGRSRSIIAELDEASKQREARIAELEFGRKEVGEQAAALAQRVERLQAELESAKEERRLSEISVGELEEALRAGDERTLQLSLRLDDKEAEASRLTLELDQLQALVDAKAAAEAETLHRLAALEAELAAKLAESEQLRESAEQTHAREVALRAGEMTSLRETIRALEAMVGEEGVARAASQAEIEALREKLASRVEEIKELQNRISEVMMQRASRDTEVALLKEKLLAMEAAALVAADRVAPGMETPVEIPEPATAPSPYAVLEVVPEDEGIPLDELPGQKPHHTPQKTEVAEAKRSQPLTEPVSWSAGDEAFTVFFNESAHDLSRAETEKIDLCARSIRRLGKKVEVTLVGYAGPEGTPDFAESLSARRADAVRERLIERGVPVGVLKVRASGQDRRFMDWKARRVELILSPVAAAETVN